MLKDVRLVEAVAIYLAAVVFATLSLLTTGQYKSAIKCAATSCLILILLLATVEIGRRICPWAVQAAPQRQITAKPQGEPGEEKPKRPQRPRKRSGRRRRSG